MSEYDYRAQRWPLELRRCEVHSRTARCPEPAVFRLFWRDREGDVCAKCLAPRVLAITHTGGEVVVTRIPATPPPAIARPW